MEGTAAIALVALSLGLAGGAHCSVMCALPIHHVLCKPHIVRHVNARVLPIKQHVSRADWWQFQAGRVIGYGLLGGVAGAVGGSVGWGATALMGSAVMKLLWALLVTWTLVEWAAASYGVLGPSARLGLGAALTSFHRALRGNVTRAGAAARGSMWALLPCGLLYAAIPLALMTGDALGGGFALMSFGLGTLPWHAASARLIRGAQATTIKAVRLVAVLAMAAATLLAWQPGWIVALLPPSLAACFAR